MCWAVAQQGSASYAVFLRQLLNESPIERLHRAVFYPPKVWYADDECLCSPIPCITEEQVFFPHLAIHRQALEWSW